MFALEGTGKAVSGRLTARLQTLLLYLMIMTQFRDNAFIVLGYLFQKQNNI